MTCIAMLSFVMVLALSIFLALSPIFLTMIEIWSLNLQVKYADREVNKTLTTAMPKGGARWLVV
jgi:hypothetical protein